MGSKRRVRSSRGQVLIPAAAIGSLAMILAAGLSGFGLLDRANDSIGPLLAEPLSAPKSLPGILVWAVAALISYGLAALMLATAGTWRRVVLWITTGVLLLAWAPVLSLAAYEPAIAPWWVAALWSGVCSIVYAHNHLMPSDEIPLYSSDAPPAA